ncbi:DedA family protein [bacterium]|nr:MAG: DedA family protein [bacterium]
MRRRFFGRGRPRFSYVAEQSHDAKNRTGVQDQFRTVLDWFATNGAWTLVVLLFAAGIGVPSPASIGLLAAGALVRSGKMDFWPVLIAVMVGSTLGHVASYWLGRKGLRGMFKRLQESKGWKKAHARYEKRREATIFMSRWLLTPLALPVNLIAGAEKYAWAKFAALCTAGNLVWILIYGGVGYAVGSAWGQLGEAARWLGYAGVAAVILIIVWMILKRRNKLRTA